MESVKLFGVAFVDCPRLTDLTGQAGIQELWAGDALVSHEGD